MNALVTGWGYITISIGVWQTPTRAITVQFLWSWGLPMLDARCIKAFALCTFLTASPQGLAAGEALFEKNCSSCHGMGGAGIPGLAPPLENPELWQALGNQALRYAVGVMTNGMSGKLEAKGQLFQGMVMPPLEHLSPENMASIANFLLSDLNRISFTVSESDVLALNSEKMNHGTLREIRSDGERYE